MSELVVETTYGKVRGLQKGGVAHWRGIPYAAPPAGELRFLPPRPPAAWTGERDATRFGPVAEQSRDPRNAMLSGLSEKATLSEDCLVLNVISPAADGARRPVMVWIHGGAFIMGSSSQPLYNGTSFAARHDVVVVSMNYRIGLLGFLYLGELAGERYRQGNVGLLDQIAALRWVRENIAAFGGDPDRITVMGESAGAISIGNLLAMPAARGLFQRAVLQSGAAWLSPPTRDDATALAREVIAELGVGAAELPGVPAARLIAVQEQITRARGLGGIAPYVDGETVPRPPTEAVRAGAAAGIPLLLGTNLDEWAMFETFMGEGAAAAGRDELLGIFGDEVRRIHAGYVSGRAARPPAGGRTVEAAAWIDVLGDVGLRVPAMRLAEAQAPHAPVWMYRFDWESTAFGGRLGAGHALELPFVWNQLDLPISAILLGDVAGARPLGAAMHDAWAAFLRGDAPAAAGLPPWPRYEAPRRATMLLDRVPRVADDPDGAVRERWAAVWPSG